MKYLLIFLLCTSSAYAENALQTLCVAVTGTGAQASTSLPARALTFQGSMTVSSGAGTAAVTIEASIDNVWFDSVGTLAITDLISDSVTFNSPRYSYYRCNVTSITGTGAATTVKYAY